MKRPIVLVLLIFLVSACQLLKPGLTVPTLAPTHTVITQVVRPQLTPTLAGSPTAFLTSTPQALPSFTVNLTQPFANTTLSGEPILLKTWARQPYAGQVIPLPIDLSRVANGRVLDGLTSAQLNFLLKYGFVVMHSQEAQFGDIRVETARRTGQPYFLTTDAALHALHLLFDDLLKAAEIQQLLPQLKAIIDAALVEVLSYPALVKGTSLEADSYWAVAYLSVALKLLDPNTPVEPVVAEVVSQQVKQVVAAGGRAQSVLFPTFEDDYSAYLPVGHYVDDPELAQYFRGMTWLGRVHFKLDDANDPGFTPSRLPLIVTLALRKTRVNDQSASQIWSSLYETLNFMIGPSDDPGPLEYAQLMDLIYGLNPSLQDLTDNQRWAEFVSKAGQLPSPQVNSTFISTTADLQVEKGWRFMGQRFTLDASIFQNLIYDKVKERTNGQKRLFPSGLDVMSVFGSDPAQQSLADLGATKYPNYLEQVALLRQAVQIQPQAQWLTRFYDTWLYTFFPLLAAKDTTYPPFMHTPAWGYKDLNTALGSWAELKHDTILYTKMPEAMGGGGPPMSAPALSYIEPNPDVFYRLAYMAQSLAQGLSLRTVNQVIPPTAPSLSLDDYLMAMNNLAERFVNLGDIAVKELTGQPVTLDDNDLITSCLGLIECQNMDTPYNRPAGEMPKAPIIAAVSGAEDSVLEVGTGYIDRIFVILPLEEKWQVAQGGVFSYYEFIQLRDQRLTDQAWREALDSYKKPPLPAWASTFLLLQGEVHPWLAFRIGDIYEITKYGDHLNLRETPSKSGSVLTQLHTDSYVEIIDGPVAAEGLTWWKLKCIFCSDTSNLGNSATGWAVESQVWYERSYLP